MSEERAVLKLGDTVTLNSGGHLMTVVSVDEDSVTCAWSVNDQVKSKSFPAKALKQASAPRPLEELVLASMNLKEPP
jgi:uncharacterized protein YodC (DUF2158 family)